MQEIMDNICKEKVVERECTCSNIRIDDLNILTVLYVDSVCVGTFIRCLDRQLGNKYSLTIVDVHLLLGTVFEC